MKYFLIILLLPAFLNSSGQVVYEVNKAADVLNYTFTLTLNDSSDVIQGKSEVTVNFSEVPDSFVLDLIGKKGSFGMTVDQVYDGNNPVNYTFENDKVNINPADGPLNRTFSIHYQGIPERGLVIDTTKFGNRSFFGDNWPNLARHWLASVDNQHDKASVEFRIIAPSRYDVVATGRKVEESHLPDGYKLTRYLEPAPVATKVMTIGVCEFASVVLGYVDDIEISAWVYPENRLEGFSDYSPAVEVMEYFIDRIGPYAFAKLANMQAKTQWGGLENAGTIAYRESSVTGNNEVEGLIAHEIAHQWFGNSATESNWNHVWLSEGFATYFTILYLENKYGQERRKEELIRDRLEIINYFDQKPSPVVDYRITDPLRVLSTNSYQKGSWVLNMLRHRLGDETFWNGIRIYYQTYFNRNASTEDFQHIMEEVSGERLGEFFRQWIYSPGQPDISWTQQFENGKLVIAINQMQSGPAFHFPLEVAITRQGQTEIKKFEINERQQTLEISMESAPENVVLDPGVWLLYRDKN